MTYVDAYFQFKLMTIVIAPIVFFSVIGICILIDKVQRWWK